MFHLTCCLSLLIFGAMAPLASETATMAPPMTPAAPAVPSGPISQLKGLSDEALYQKVMQESRIASDGWLSIVDRGDYGSSWDSASPLLKRLFDRQGWTQTLDRIRKPLGGVKSRQVADIRMAKDPEGAPKGNYMIYIYNTTFANGKAGSEIVTLLEGNDGVWRVSSYLVTAK